MAARRERSLNQLCVELLGNGIVAGSEKSGPAAIASEVAPAALMARLTRRLRRQLEGVVLFGSAARGEMREGSDLDLLIVLRRAVRIARDLYSIWDAEIAPPVEPHYPRTSPHFVALPSDPASAGGLWLEAALDGVILWDPQLRVARILRLLRQEIAHGSLVRKLAHGQPYWARVPQDRLKSAPLAEDYIRRPRKRLAALDALCGERAWPDVVREAQEVVELALKGLARRYRIETPRLHDVSDVLVESRTVLSEALAADLERLCEISRRLRRDRELAFYGSEDLTPSDFYREKDARLAREDARWVVQTVEREFGKSSGGLAETRRHPNRR